MPATNKQKDPFHHNPWGFSSWSKFFKTQILMQQLIWSDWEDRPGKPKKWSRVGPLGRETQNAGKSNGRGKKRLVTLILHLLEPFLQIHSNTMNLWSLHCTSIYLIYTFLLIYLHDCYLRYSIINHHLLFQRELLVAIKPIHSSSQDAHLSVPHQNLHSKHRLGAQF